MMVIASFFFALFMTLSICLGILLIKWVVAEVSAVIFCALLFTLFAVFVLATCEEDEVEG